MRSIGLLASTIAGVLTLSFAPSWPNQAAAQGPGPETVSPCCAKVCNTDGSSTRCKPLLLGGLGSAPMDAVGHGCLDAETAHEIEAAWKRVMMLNATHVIIDLHFRGQDFAPWREAARRHGRLVHGTEQGELYEFDALSVAGADLFLDQSHTLGTSEDISIAFSSCDPNVLPIIGGIKLLNFSL